MPTYDVDIEARVLNSFEIEAANDVEAAQKAKELLLEDNDVAEIYNMSVHPM